MASIYWVGRSAYLNWRQNGTRHRESLGQITKDEAETARRAKELELRTGKRILSHAELFRDFALTYLEWHEAEYPDSHDRIEYIIVKVFKDFREYPLDRITPYEIEQWKHRRARKVSDGTVLKELRTLSALFNRAIIWGQLSANPVKMVKKPKDHSGEPPTWFTPEQLQALYDVSGQRAHWWRLMANTGMRRSEAQHLRWQDVRDGRLHILSREGARTKSGKWRQVPLSKGAQAALDALRPEKDIPEYVLPPMVGRSLTRHFTKDAEKAGIPGTLHSLRHTFAATLVQRGRPLREVQELMGHASITTTQIYAHLAPENLEAAVTVLDL